MQHYVMTSIHWSASLTNDPSSSLLTWFL